MIKADKILKINVAPGIFWVEIPSAELRILCGCPADAVKHLVAIGLIKEYDHRGLLYESGPNAILLSEAAIQKGQFCNLGEFPVLQMLYKQGMIIPGHFNNNGQRPYLIGKPSQVKAQLEYIYRGNYGLVSVEELREAGLTEAEADDIYRMKLSFAFGKFELPDKFIRALGLEQEKIEIKENVFIERTAYNHFQISYENESVEVDLNLLEGDRYRPPYHLGFRNIERQHFTIIHSGDGDGWDVKRPCMGSVVVYNSDVFLIDAGPNILMTLNALGISISEIKGIFHTHCHDDHFNGLTALIQADHRIKYFATPLVRSSVSKKLSALMSLDYDILARYFDIEDLHFNLWNNVEGMEVMPFLSPHPVETSNFLFRVVADGGYRTYYHMADISSLRVLEGMVTEDDKAPGISSEFFETVKKNYLIDADIKKIDIGGGLIHGVADDFLADQSRKIILSHLSRDLNNSEKMIGSRASFGLEDTLIESNSNPILKYAKKYLAAYFANIDFRTLKDMLNCPLVLFSAGETILRKGEQNNHFYLTLTGNVEVIFPNKKINQLLSAGCFVGEMSALLNEPRQKTYIASSYVWALKIPSNMYREFVKKHNLREEIINGRSNRGFLSSLNIFHEISSSAVINKMANSFSRIQVAKGKRILSFDTEALIVIIEGEVILKRKGKIIEKVGPGEVCGEDVILSDCQSEHYLIETSTDTTYGLIPGEFIRSVPSVMWNLLEIHQKRTE